MVASGSFGLLTPGDPRYFTHVGRVVVITADGHARQPNLRMKCILPSVGSE